MDQIVCPECEYIHTIAKLELWEVYSEDGAETEVDCHGCGKPLIITSAIIGWEFDVMVND